MALHSSSWLPWVFFGPLFLALLSGSLYQFTGIALFATLAKTGLALTLLAAALAFLASFRANSRVKIRQQGPDTD